MQIGGFWLLIIIVGFMASAFGLAGDVLLGQTNRDLQVIADQALTNAEGPMLSTLLSEQQNGQSFSLVPTARTGACATGETCTFYVLVAYQLTGSTESGGGTANETAADLQGQAKLNEQLEGVTETATVTNAQGSVLATRSRRLTVRVSNVRAEVVARFDDAADSGSAIAAQGVGGCNGSSSGGYASTCNSDAQQVGADTASHAYLQCVDDPALYAYCNGATPRPADAFRQPSWQNNDASSNGFSR